ncbi:TPA: phosphate-binding protein, partial [Candidatus Acetothermia bacterium]|nr:phosphate-binding protein [Candidatus Acetothermia bacterium]
LFKVSNAAIAGAVAATRGGIGYVGIGFVGPGVAAVAVAAREGDPFVYPTLETIADGTYVLSRPLFLFTDGWPEGALLAFIRFAQSPAGQELVLKEGFGSIPRI